MIRLRISARRLERVLDGTWQPPPHLNGRWERANGSAAWRLVLQQGENVQHVASELAASGVPFSIAPPTLADVFEQLTGSQLSEMSIQSSTHAEELA